MFALSFNCNINAALQAAVAEKTIMANGSYGLITKTLNPVKRKNVSMFSPYFYLPEIQPSDKPEDFSFKNAGECPSGGLAAEQGDGLDLNAFLPEEINGVSTKSFVLPEEINGVSTKSFEFRFACLMLRTLDKYEPASFQSKEVLEGAALKHGEALAVAAAIVLKAYDNLTDSQTEQVDVFIEDLVWDTYKLADPADLVASESPEDAMSLEALIGKFEEGGVDLPASYQKFKEVAMPGSKVIFSETEGNATGTIVENPDGSIDAKISVTVPYEAEPAKPTRDVSEVKGKHAGSVRSKRIENLSTMSQAMLRANARNKKGDK